MAHQKKTIVHIVPKFCFGGAERLVALYAKKHDYDAFDVHVIACVADGPLRTLFAGSKATIFAADRSTYGGRYGAWKALRQYLDDIKPDVIHTHLLTSDVLGFVYRMRAKKRPFWVSTQHNVEDSRPWLYKKIWRFILPKADRVVAVAPRVYDYAHLKFGVPKDRLQLVLNGIELAKWIPAAAEPVFRSNELHIGTIGRFETQKGHTYAFDALAQLPSDLEWTYHLFGTGVLEPELRAQAESLGILPRIVWHGVVDDMEDRIGALDIVLQPSLFEGLSLVILESMAAGRVVLTTPAGGEGVITDGTNGYIVPSEDSAAIANAITSISEHRDAAGAAAAAGAALAAETFDIQKNVSSLENIYTVATDNRV